MNNPAQNIRRLSWWPDAAVNHDVPVHYTLTGVPACRKREGGGAACKLDDLPGNDARQNGKVLMPAEGVGKAVNFP